MFSEMAQSILSHRRARIWMLLPLCALIMFALAGVRPMTAFGTPVASFTINPNPVAPGTQVTFDAGGSVNTNSWTTGAGSKTAAGAWGARGHFSAQRIPGWGSLLRPAGHRRSHSRRGAPARLAVNAAVTITDYKWDLDGSGNYATDTGTVATTHNTYSTRGPVVIGLQVTDSTGATARSTQTLYVTQPPVAAIAPPASPIAGQPASFDASASTHDPAGSIVDYRWDLDGSGQFATDTQTTPSATTTYSTHQSVRVSVRVTDDTGASATTAIVVTVNSAPAASFTAPAPALAGQPVTLDGSASTDSSGPITDYRWDLDGSGAYATDTGTTPNVVHTFSSPGPVNVGLRIADSNGHVATTTHTIQITRPPVAQLTATPASPVSGQSVTLDASASTDPDGIVTAYAWDLDGSGQFATSTGSTPFLQHAFTAGAHLVSVRVTDNYGATSTASITVSVAAGSGPSGPDQPGSGTGPTSIGGDPQAGIASLTGPDLTAIVAGSANHFASITGVAMRRSAVVSRHGLWVNLLTDRSARFDLVLSVSAADARRLGAGGRHATGLVRLASVSTSLQTGGQRPFDIVLSRSLRSKLQRFHGRVLLIVTGNATDAAKRKTVLARGFALRS
jgi:PKD repeat protein